MNSSNGSMNSPSFDHQSSTNSNNGSNGICDLCKKYEFIDFVFIN